MSGGSAAGRVQDAPPPLQMRLLGPRVGLMMHRNRTRRKRTCGVGSLCVPSGGPAAYESSEDAWLSGVALPVTQVDCVRWFLRRTREPSAMPRGQSPPRAAGPCIAGCRRRPRRLVVFRAWASPRQASRPPGFLVDGIYALARRGRPARGEVDPHLAHRPTCVVDITAARQGRLWILECRTSDMTWMLVPSEFTELGEVFAVTDGDVGVVSSPSGFRLTVATPTRVERGTALAEAPSREARGRPRSPGGFLRLRCLGCRCLARARS